MWRRRHWRSPPAALRADRRSPRRCGRRAPGNRRASTTLTAGQPRCATTGSTRVIRIQRFVHSRKRWPSSKGRRRRWRSHPEWERSQPRCSRCAPRAATSSHSVSCTPARSPSCKGRAAGWASTSPTSTSPRLGRSPKRSCPATRCWYWRRRRRTPCWSWPTSTSSVRSRARSPWSTRRSQHHSASSRSRTVSTSRCIRPPRESPGTTTPPLASSRVTQTSSARSGPIRCCTAQRRRHSTH